MVWADGQLRSGKELIPDSMVWTRRFYGFGYRLSGEIMYFALDEDQAGNFVVAWDKAGEQMDSGLPSFVKPTLCN